MTTVIAQVQPMYSKQQAIESADVRAQGASQMISMICERLREADKPLTEFERT